MNLRLAIIVDVGRLSSGGGPEEEDADDEKEPLR